jgi:hypothetical protein
MEILWVLGRTIGMVGLYGKRCRERENWRGLEWRAAQEPLHWSSGIEMLDLKGEGSVGNELRLRM